MAQQPAAHRRSHQTNHGPPRQGLPSSATRPKRPRTSSSARLPPSTSQRTPPASSLRHRTTRSCHRTPTSSPNFDSACPTADGEFATIRHQPWDFATRRGTLQHWSCSFSNLLSVRDALNCTETGRLTGCPARVVSPSCPIFPPPHLTVVGSCAVLDRTRWHGSQFRHGDDQIPSGGSFRAVPQQHSIFDLRVARGVRYRKGPVRWVPRHADANLMYGSVHTRQHDG